MLGLGVAFAATRFLSLFMTDLVNELQPLSLLLNGVTAAFAAWGFANSGLIDWRKALTLAAVTTVFAPSVQRQLKQGFGVLIVVATAYKLAVVLF